MLLARVAEGFELAVGFLAITVPDARKPVDEPADEPRFEVARVNVGLALHDIVPQQPTPPGIFTALRARIMRARVRR
jgi:hypothetical protein